MRNGADPRRGCGTDMGIKCGTDMGIKCGTDIRIKCVILMSFSPHFYVSVYMPNLAYAFFYCSSLSAILYSCCSVFFYLKLYTILGSLVYLLTTYLQADKCSKACMRMILLYIVSGISINDIKRIE